MKKLSSKTRKLLIAAVAVVLTVAIVVGIVFGLSRKGGDPVPVFTFDNVGMTEFWGDTQESYGPVSTDRIQTVFLSETQEVTGILVSQGDSVKKGDLLMRFDTTLNDLKLERKRLEVEKLKLQLEDDKTRLQEIKNMKPMVIPDTSDTPSENLGKALEGNYQVFPRTEHDGSTAEKAIICWVSSSYSMGDRMFDTVMQAAQEQQNANAPEPEDPDDPGEEGSGTGEGGGTGEGSGTGEGGGTGEGSGTGEGGGSGEDGGSSPSALPEEKPEESDKPFPVDQCYMVIKITSGDMSRGTVQAWQGVYLSRVDGGFTLRFFNASGNLDYTLAEETQVEMPEIDFGSGFTAAQIYQMRLQQEKTIKDDEFKIKVAEAEYKIMQREISDGNVYAEIDGTVVSCLTEEEARSQNQPILKVSGGGGFTITGAVSELLKDQLTIGQEVTINDWNSGVSYVGSITTVGDFPTSNNFYSGMGNTNVSYYPFTVFVDESADLREGDYVNITFSTASAENGIYLQNPFVRTEKGRSYVMVAGQDGRLEQRYVTTGKALWGSYTEILSGLTVEDRVAFPYGKNVKPGAPTVDGDISDLYR